MLKVKHKFQQSKRAALMVQGKSDEDRVDIKFVRPDEKLNGLEEQKAEAEKILDSADANKINKVRDILKSLPKEERTTYDINY